MSRKWYVIHSQSGLENKVKERLESRIKSMDMGELVSRVLVPVEEIAEVRGGQKKVIKKTSYPGYVLIETEMNQKVREFISATNGVTGFVGPGNKAVALEQEEVDAILNSIEEKGAKPKPRIGFERGDAIRIVEGPFANFNGTVDECFAEKGKLKAMISIFGRLTPVELEYWQVEKG